MQMVLHGTTAGVEHQAHCANLYDVHAIMCIGGLSMFVETAGISTHPTDTYLAWSLDLPFALLSQQSSSGRHKHLSDAWQKCCRQAERRGVFTI